MQIPAVMFIEMAIDGTGDANAQVMASTLREVQALGRSRVEGFYKAVEEKLATLPPDTLTGLIEGRLTDNGDQFEMGYLLGIAVARVLLMTMPKAVEAGVEL